MSDLPRINLSLAEFQGKSQEEIFASLLTRGYKLEQINLAFKAKNAKPEHNKKEVNTDFFTVAGSILGAVILGTGIISLIAANWSSINDVVKISIILSALVLFYTLAILAYTKLKNLWLSQSLFLVASITYGGSIFLVDQIFNLPLDTANSFLIWFLGVFALAFVLKSKLQEYLGLLILCFAIPTNIFIFFGYSYFSQRREFIQDVALVLIIISAAASFIWSNNLRREKSDNQLVY
jgi:uncharacterized membrane protein